MSASSAAQGCLRPNRFAACVVHLTIQQKIRFFQDAQKNLAVVLHSRCCEKDWVFVDEHATDQLRQSLMPDCIPNDITHCVFGFLDTRTTTCLNDTSVRQHLRDFGHELTFASPNTFHFSRRSSRKASEWFGQITQGADYEDRLWFKTCDVLDNPWRGPATDIGNVTLRKLEFRNKDQMFDSIIWATLKGALLGIVCGVVVEGFIHR